MVATLASLRVAATVLGALRRGAVFRTAEALDRAGHASLVVFCARGTLLRSINPSRLILSEQFFVREGDESQDAIELHLARELKPGVELGLKVAHYLGELGAQSEVGGQDLGFRRTVAQLAVAWSRAHGTPQPPQSVVVLRAVSQPLTVSSQSSQGAVHDTITHAPP